MNRYETVCIIRPDVGDDVVKGIIGKATEALVGGGGEVSKLEEWGRRRLAYPIGKKHEGYYFVLSYSSLPAVSKEIERLMRLNEDVLRYQTVRLHETKPVAEEKKESKEAEGGEHGISEA